jgi:hypothetical protein
MSQKGWRPALGLVLVLLLEGCGSVPFVGSPLPSDSSLLAVDVRFPVPMGRDPELVGVFFVRGPIHAGMKHDPEWIPASFVKGARAYLLDPQPGTYSLVAVGSYFAPPRSATSHPLVPGVIGTVSIAGDAGDVVVLPDEMIRRTRTTIGPGRVAFMGALQVARGERINANTRFEDLLQARVAEAIRPGVTSQSGLAGLFTMMWGLDLEQSSLGNEESDRDSFFAEARADFGESAWAGIVAPSDDRVARPVFRDPVPTPALREPAPVARNETGAVPSAPPPAPTATTAIPSAPPAPTATTAIPSAPPAPTATTAIPSVPPPPPGPTVTTPSPTPVAAVPSAPPPPPPMRPAPRPKKLPFPGVPSGSPLAKVLAGMTADDVREVLGDPDDRHHYLTAKAWIPFYTGSDAQQIDWRYSGQGRVVFSMDRRTGVLEVLDVRYDPGELK